MSHTLPAEVHVRAPSGFAHWLAAGLALLAGAGLAEARAGREGMVAPAAAPVEADRPGATAVPPGPRVPHAAPGLERRIALFEVPDVSQPGPRDELAEPEGRGTRGLGEAFRGGRIISGETSHRLILFTFDDGPDRRTTPLLLDRLEAAGIRGVFFLVASRFAGGTPTERLHAAIARDIVRRGHLVGHHTLDHAQLPQLDDLAVRHQVLAAEAAFERALGGRPFLFRPPFGAHSQRIDQLLAERDYTIVLWNLGSGDFQVRSADEVFDTWLKVFARREQEHGDRGGVILLHDTYAWSVDAFERIVSYLRARNCEFLASGEELYDFVDDPGVFFTPRAGAPADAVAPRLELSPSELQARQAVVRAKESARCGALFGGR